MLGGNYGVTMGLMWHVGDQGCFMDSHIAMSQAQESFMLSRSQKVKGRDDILNEVRQALLGVVAMWLLWEAGGVGVIMDTHVAMKQAQESFMLSRSQKVKGRDDILSEVRRLF